MKLTYIDLFDNSKKIIDAEISTDHPSSHYGIPVIVLEDGGALDYQSAILLNYEIEEMTEDEKPLIARWQAAMPPLL